MNAIQQAQELIDQSISRDEITHAEFDADIAEELEAASDGGTRNDSVTEYWGVTESGDEWRVHLDHASRN